MDPWKRLEFDEWNVQAWTELLQKALSDLKQSKSSLNTARNTFDKFLEKFPTCAKYWIAYLEFELRQSGNASRVKKLFEICLFKVPNLSLWKLYLDFIKKEYPLSASAEAQVRDSGSESENRLTVGRAFEFALEHVGYDVESGVIWQDYISFLQSQVPQTPKEESQKMDLIRHTYSRALIIPLTNIEALWRAYDSFENNLNKIVAKKLIAERSTGYMSARSHVRELHSVLNQAKRLAESWVPCPPTWSDAELQLLTLWKRYISWEKRNPLQLTAYQVMKRCTYSFRLALTTHCHFAELWLSFADFFIDHDHFEDAADVFKRALSEIPASLLVRFKYAEILEKQSAEFSELATVFDDGLEALLQQKLRLERECEYKKQHVKISPSALSAISAASGNALMDGDFKERARVLEQAVKDQRNQIEDERDVALNKVDEAVGLLWIQYIKVGRRCKGMRFARSLFSQARKSWSCPFQVFVSCALLEFRCSKSTEVAERVFELGWKTFIDSFNQRMVEKSSAGLAKERALDQLEAQSAASFAYFYLRFVMLLNDENNTRALFERIVANVPAKCSQQIWEVFLEFEQLYGDLGNLVRVMNRYKETFGEGMTAEAELTQTSARYDCFGLRVIHERELGISFREAYMKAHADDDKFMGKFSGEASTGAFAGGANRPSVMISVTPENFARPNLDSEESSWIPHQPEALQVLENGDMVTGETGEEVAVMVPEPVATLLDQLPGIMEFNGPTILAEELLALLQVVRLPATSPTAHEVKMVPAPSPHYRKQIISETSTYTPAISVLSQITGLNFSSLHISTTPPIGQAPPVQQAAPSQPPMSLRSSTPGTGRTRASSKRHRGSD